MRARLTQMLAGSTRSYEIGEEVEGDFALGLIEAGFAVPIVEKPTKETASKKTVSKETRTKK